MAIVGARPAPHPWLGWRRGQPKRRPRPQSARRSRASRLRAPADVRPLVVAILAAAALAFFYLSQSTSVAARGYEIDSLESVLADRQAEQQQLILSIGRAQSPSVITQRATTELRLVPLDPGAVTYARPADDSAD